MDRVQLIDRLSVDGAHLGLQFQLVHLLVLVLHDDTLLLRLGLHHLDRLLRCGLLWLLLLRGDGPHARIGGQYILIGLARRHYLLQLWRCRGRGRDLLQLISLIQDKVVLRLDIRLRLQELVHLTVGLHSLLVVQGLRLNLLDCERVLLRLLRLVRSILHLEMIAVKC